MPVIIPFPARDPKIRIFGSPPPANATHERVASRANHHAGISQSLDREGDSSTEHSKSGFQPLPIMHVNLETNARYKFNLWLEEQPAMSIALEEPLRPASFNGRNRVKAITEPALAEVYVLQTPDRPAA